MVKNNITRRNFLKLTGLMAGSTAIALSPKKAFGWLAFEFAGKTPIWEIFGFNDPIHEDSAQFAYSIVLQRHKKDIVEDKGPQSILNPAYKFYSKKDYTANQYFLENFKMLRYGAHWNDASAFGLLDFLPSVIGKNEILDWQNTKSPYYEDIIDIAEHVKQNQNRDYNTFIQFNNNGRLDCLHGMLNSYADGENKSGHVSQALNKELLLQWFKAAYKFAVDGEKFPNSNIRYFFDTNNQYSPNLDKDMLIDDSASFIDTNDTKYNTRQLRIRVLGMICHTIQDLWNPAHTIRSYYKDKNNEDRFGKILAFGNYSKQSKGLGANNHKPYDLCASVDPKWDNKNLRDILIDEMTPHQGAPERIPVEKENFLNNIIGWNGSKHSKNISIDNACRQFNTLSLKYTIKYLSDFLEIAYLRINWSGQAFYYNTNVDFQDNPVSLSYSAGFTKFNSVEDWFNNFVLKTMFDFYGDSYIYDSGIKTTLSEYEILPFVDNLSEVIKSHFGEKGKELIDLLTNLIDAHNGYVDLAKEFYTNHNTMGTDYLQDAPECMAKTSQDHLFTSLKTILTESEYSFKNLILPDIKLFLEDLQLDQYVSWNNLVKLICGFLQELYLEIDDSHNVNAEIAKLNAQLIGKETKISFTGYVENIWEHNDSVCVQIRNEDNNTINFKCNKSQMDNYKDLTIGSKDIKVNCDLALSIDESGVYIFHVDSVKVPAITPDHDASYFVRAKINEVDKHTFSATVLDFSKNGNSLYTFEYDANIINIENNYEYLLSYKAINNKLVCVGASQYDQEKNTIKRHSSQIIYTYSNCLEYLVKTPLPEKTKSNEELLESDLLYFDESQICGALKPGNDFEFICIGNDLPDNNKSNNIAYGYKKATRIKSSNYNHDKSMDFYIPKQNGKHIKTDKKLCSSEIEACTFVNGKCIYCGNMKEKKRDDAQSSLPDTSDKNGVLIAGAAAAATIGTAGIAYENNRHNKQTDYSN